MKLNHREARKTIGVVLAGGKGERLSPLTRLRPKPGVPLVASIKLSILFSVTFSIQGSGKSMS